MTHPMPAESTTASRRKPRTARPLAPADALAFRVNDARIHAGLSRTTLYKLINDGRLKALNVAGRTLIEGDSLRALLRGDQARQDQPSAAA